MARKKRIQEWAHLGQYPPSDLDWMEIEELAGQAIPEVAQSMLMGAAACFVASRGGDYADLKEIQEVDKALHKLQYFIGGDGNFGILGKPTKLIFKRYSKVISEMRKHTEKLMQAPDDRLSDNQQLWINMLDALNAGKIPTDQERLIVKEVLDQMGVGFSKDAIRIGLEKARKWQNSKPTQ